MTFARTFLLSSQALIALGIGALVIAGFLPATSLLLLAAAIAARAWPAADRRLQAAPRALINSVTLAVFAYLLLVEALLADDFIGAVVAFTVYLQFLRLLTARRSREYFQTYVLALAHLILSALLTAELAFALPFLLFVLLAPWCFTLYSLQAQAERAYTAAPSPSSAAAPTPPAPITDGRQRFDALQRSRHAVSGRLFAATTLLSLAVLAITILIFAAFPRISSGFLFRRATLGSPVTGFSDRVDLRAFGVIKESEALVMRVTQRDGPAIAPADCYWRGLAYDRYDGHEWLRTERETRRLRLDPRNATIILHRVRWAGLVRLDMQLERLDSAVFFALDVFMGAQWQPEHAQRAYDRTSSGHRTAPALAEDRYGALTFEGRLAEERTYTTFSRIDRPTPDALRAAAPLAGAPDLPQADGPAGMDYLQLPPMSPRFLELATNLTAQTPTRYDAVLAVIDHLKTTCTYTLNIPRPGRNPVETFLFEKPRGHCEYFATAAVLLMRAAGIPARLVSGFRGGEWNPYGRYLSVRERHAHTWIEIHFPELGWIRFDPTPPDNAAAGYRGLRFAALRHLLEWAELRWFNNVVNYSFSDQRALVRGTLGGLQDWLRPLAALRFDRLSLANLRQQLTRGAGATTTPALPPTPLLLAAAGVMALLLLRRRRRHQAQRRADGPVAFYRDFLALAARRGYPKQPAETAREFAQRLADTWPEAESLASRLAGLYYRQRFGAQSPSHEERRAIRQGLQQLATLPRRKKESP